MFKQWKEDSFLNEFMFQKGGSSPPPPEPPPDHTLEIEQMRMDRERERAAEEARAKELEEQQRMQRAQGALNSAYLGGRNLVKDKLNGLETRDHRIRNSILDDYMSQLDQAKALVPRGEENVGQYINPNAIWSSASDAARTQHRNRLSREANDTFGEGFERKAFDDTADDPILNAIMQDQYTTAQADIQRAQARGQLNPMGYETAMRELNKGKSKANSTLQGLGGSVLARYRTGLEDIGKSVHGRIDDWDYGDDFSMGRERSRLNDEVNKYRGTLEGDIRTAAESASLFDVDLLLGKARGAQGDVNTGALANAFAAAAPASTITDPTKRVVASTGVF